MNEKHKLAIRQQEYRGYMTGATIQIPIASRIAASPAIE
jgi:hypothetical protein